MMRLRALVLVLATMPATLADERCPAAGCDCEIDTLGTGGITLDFTLGYVDGLCEYGTLTEKEAGDSGSGVELRLKPGTGTQGTCGSAVQFRARRIKTYHTRNGTPCPADCQQYVGGFCNPVMQPCPGRSTDTCAPTPAPTPIFSCNNFANAHCNLAKCQSFDDCTCNYNFFKENDPVTGDPVRCVTAAPTPSPTPRPTKAPTPVSPDSIRSQCQATDFFPQRRPQARDAGADRDAWNKLRAVSNEIDTDPASHPSEAQEMAFVSRWHTIDPQCASRRANCFPNLAALALDETDTPDGGSFFAGTGAPVVGGQVVKVGVRNMSLAVAGEFLGADQYVGALAVGRSHVFVATNAKGDGSTEMYRVDKITLRREAVSLKLSKADGHSNIMHVILDTDEKFLYAVSRAPAVVKIDVSVWAQHPCATSACSLGGSNALPAGLIRNGARDTTQAPFDGRIGLVAMQQGGFGVAVSDGLLGASFAELQDDMLYIVDEASNIEPGRVVKAAKVRVSDLKILNVQRIGSLSHAGAVASDAQHLYVAGSIDGNGHVASVLKSSLLTNQSKPITINAAQSETNAMQVDSTFLYLGSASSSAKTSVTKIKKQDLTELPSRTITIPDAPGLRTAVSTATHLYFGLYGDNTEGQITKVRKRGRYEWVKLNSGESGSPCNRYRTVRCTDASGRCALDWSECQGEAPAAKMGCAVGSCKIDGGCSFTRDRSTCVTDDVCGPCKSGFYSPDFIGNSVCLPVSKALDVRPALSNGDGARATDYCGSYEPVCTPDTLTGQYYTVQMAIGADSTFLRRIQHFADLNSCQQAVTVKPPEDTFGQLHVYTGKQAHGNFSFELKPFGNTLIGGANKFGRIKLKQQVGITPATEPGESRGPFGALCMSPGVITRDQVYPKNGQGQVFTICAKRTSACEDIKARCGQYNGQCVASGTVSTKQRLRIDKEGRFELNFEQWGSSKCTGGTDFSISGTGNATAVGLAGNTIGGNSIFPWHKLKLAFDSFIFTPNTPAAATAASQSCPLPETWKAGEAQDAGKAAIAAAKAYDEANIADDPSKTDKLATLNLYSQCTFSDFNVKTTMAMETYERDPWIAFVPYVHVQTPATAASKAAKDKFICLGDYDADPFLSSSLSSLPNVQKTDKTNLLEKCLQFQAPGCTAQNGVKFTGAEVRSKSGDTTIVLRDVSVTDDCCEACRGLPTCIAWRADRKQINPTVLYDCRFFTELTSDDIKDPGYVSAKLDDACRLKVTQTVPTPAPTPSRLTNKGKRQGKCGQFWESEKGGFPAQCDTNSAPCCSPEGNCGSSPNGHCDCPLCVDYRNNKATPQAMSKRGFDESCAAAVNNPKFTAPTRNDPDGTCNSGTCIYYPNSCPRYLCGAGLTRVNGEYYVDIGVGQDLYKAVRTKEDNLCYNPGDDDPRKCPGGVCSSIKCEEKGSARNPNPDGFVDFQKLHLPPTPKYYHRHNTSYVVMWRDDASGRWIIEEYESNPRRVYYYTKGQNFDTPFHIPKPTQEDREAGRPGPADGWVVGPYGVEPVPSFQDIFEIPSTFAEKNKAALKTYQCQGIWSSSGDDNIDKAVDFSACTADLVCSSPTEEIVLDAFCEKDTGALVRTKPVLAPCDEDEGKKKGNERIVYGQLRMLVVGERWPLPGVAALPANATTTAAEDDARLHEIARDLMANKSFVSNFQHQLSTFLSRDAFVLPERVTVAHVGPYLPPQARAVQSEAVKKMCLPVNNPSKYRRIDSGLSAEAYNEAVSRFVAACSEGIVVDFRVSVSANKVSSATMEVNSLSKIFNSAETSNDLADHMRQWVGPALFGKTAQQVVEDVVVQTLGVSVTDANAPSYQQIRFDTNSSIVPGQFLAHYTNSSRYCQAAGAWHLDKPVSVQVVSGGQVQTKVGKDVYGIDLTENGLTFSRSFPNLTDPTSDRVLFSHFQQCVVHSAVERGSPLEGRIPSLLDLRCDSGAKTCSMCVEMARGNADADTVRFIVKELDQCAGFLDERKLDPFLRRCDRCTKNEHCVSGACDFDDCTCFAQGKLVSCKSSAFDARECKCFSDRPGTDAAENIFNNMDGQSFQAAGGQGICPRALEVPLDNTGGGGSSGIGAGALAAAIVGSVAVAVIGVFIMWRTRNIRKSTAWRRQHDSRRADVPTQSKFKNPVSGATGFFTRMSGRQQVTSTGTASTDNNLGLQIRGGAKSMDCGESDGWGHAGTAGRASQRSVHGQSNPMHAGDVEEDFF